jgi:predicted nucleotidyltransferase
MSIVFGTKLRQKVLGYFFTHPEQRFYVRELARLINEDPTNLGRELSKLEKEGILKFEEKGKEKYYSVNKDYPLYSDMKKMIVKTVGIEGSLKEILLKIGGIKYAFIFGSFAKKRESAASDVDLFLIGKFNEDKLIEKIDNFEKKFSRVINYHIYLEKDLQKKLKEKDSFLKNIFDGPKIMLIGTEDDLQRLGK